MGRKHKDVEKKRKDNDEEIRIYQNLKKEGGVLFQRHQPRPTPGTIARPTLRPSIWWTILLLLVLLRPYQPGTVHPVPLSRVFCFIYPSWPSPLSIFLSLFVPPRLLGVCLSFPDSRLTKRCSLPTATIGLHSLSLFDQNLHLRSDRP